jgi:vacuolar-type H+-ATPase subunit I/STV1
LYLSSNSATDNISGTHEDLDLSGDTIGLRHRLREAEEKLAAAEARFEEISEEANERIKKAEKAADKATEKAAKRLTFLNKEKEACIQDAIASERIARY